MAKPVPFDNLLIRLIEDSQDVTLLWQLGVLAVCALLAWGLVRLSKPYLDRPDSLWSFGRVGIRRVGFPLAMLLALLLGRELAGIWLANTHLLNLAVRQPSGGEGLWSVYATHEFSETYLEASEMEASNRAASALMGLLGLPWPVEIEASHLWRYARPVASIGGFWVGDRENRVALIGDGIAGVGVERAWESGTRLGLKRLHRTQEPSRQHSERSAWLTERPR